MHVEFTDKKESLVLHIYDSLVSERSSDEAYSDDLQLHDELRL